MTPRTATTAILAILLLGALPLPAQELLFLGDRLESTWCSDGGEFLFVQTEPRVRAFRRRAHGGFTLDETVPLPTPAQLAGADVFDADARSWVMLKQGEVRSSAGDLPPRVPASFARVPFGEPLRCSLLRPEGVLLPMRAGVFARVGQEPFRGFALGTRTRLSAGWGIGWDLEVETRLPRLHLLRRPEGTLLASILDGELRLDDAKGERRKLPLAFDDEAGVLGIPYEIPSQRVDLEGDGHHELLAFDPSAGAVFVARSFESGSRPQLLRSGGVLLDAWVSDVAGDARPELVLLRIPRLNALARFNVLQTTRVLGTLLVYDPAPKGGFARSPRLRRRLPLRLFIRLVNGRREARLAGVLAPLFGERMVHASPEGKLSLVPLNQPEGSTPVGKLPEGSREGIVLRPRPGEVIFGWKTPQELRLYHWRDPRD